MPTEVVVTPWYGGESKTLLSLEGTDRVAYSWVSIPDRPDEPKTIDHLMVWHDCDKRLWRADPRKDQRLVDQYLGWHPSGVGHHDLISAEPLHIEASVYWPSCCGLHGWIRGGKWVDA